MGERGLVGEETGLYGNLRVGEPFDEGPSLIRERDKVAIRDIGGRKIRGDVVDDGGFVKLGAVLPITPSEISQPMVLMNHFFTTEDSSAADDSRS